MKFSNNTLFVDHYPDKDDCLAYNTRTQALVKISHRLKNIVNAYNSQEEHTRQTYHSTLNVLHEMGIVVRNEEEDTALLKSHLEQIKHSVISNSLYVTILTTYACNLKCTYCFQETSRANEKMTFPTANDVMNWLKEQVQENGYTELYINFYGGEPLVNRPILEHIAGTMQKWCQDRKISFKFMMQTNGYLMTPDLIKKYLLLGLQHVRISVDGVKEDHDRNRPLRKGGGTFDVIMKNIKDCAYLTNIALSVSYDKGDISHIEKLLDYLDDSGILQDLGEFIFSPVFATLGPEGNAEKIRNPSCMCNFENDNLVDANRRIREMMIKRNLPQRSGLSTSICPLTRSHAGSTIDQHGRIYRCNSMLGHEEFAVGHVSNNSYNETREMFLNLDVWQQCPVDCSFMPICSGGCRLSSFLKNKNFRTPTCHKPYLYAMAPRFIKEEYNKIQAEQKKAVTS
jgi:uncharacterized protein